jgi:2Fe-2S ferredoxin
MYTITFEFDEEGAKPVTLKQVEAGQSLLEVTLSHQVLLRHQCGGVAACSTCHVYLMAGNEYIEPVSKREIHYINKALEPKESSRLACQCILQEGSGDIRVIIPDHQNVIP